MYYLKNESKNGKTYKVDIYGDDVYTTCAKCGNEFKVDIVELIQSDSNFDFCSTSVYCTDCANKFLNRT